MTTIRFEQDHGVGTIVLANPPSNRIGSQFAVDLRAAVHDASLSDSRVLVIRSDGPNFCMGGNVPEWPGKSADWFRTFIAECNSSFHAIEALRIPTVAVVRGGAIGGGFELALACDFLVAAEDATFFAVEIRSGNIPLAGGLQRLAERVGRARAAKLALLGEPFSGIIAGDLGIATHSWCLKPIWRKRAVISWKSSRTAQPRLMRQRARFSKRGRREASPQRT